MSDEYVPASERVMDNYRARRAARCENLRDLDLSAYEDVEQMTVADLRAGMIVDRLVYAPYSNRPEFITDVVARVEPSTVIVDGSQVTWFDGSISGHGREEAFIRVLVPTAVAAS